MRIKNNFLIPRGRRDRKPIPKGESSYTSCPIITPHATEPEERRIQEKNFDIGHNV